MSKTKPFDIPKELIWMAYKRVKANQGACGVDGVSIQNLEEKLKDNLYKLWNRMSSGSYHPLPVRTVEIPKKTQGTRPLGIPTVLDRIAQMVVKMKLEPEIEPYFHPDSYGYRPKKSAIQALGQTRRRSWQYDWVIDLDIKGFFDNLDHELIMKAMRHHTDCKWILIYIERWLKAPAQDKEGNLIKKCKGTPQGGVISPLISNLFLHYALDEWMKKHYPHCPFERYADDVVIHCKTKEEARQVMEAIAKRLTECKLELHPTKTQIVYCKDSNRLEEYPRVKFDFLGYTFRPRRSRNSRGQHFIAFTPAISNQSAKAMRHTMKTWKLHRCSDESLESIANRINPALNGWINYYGQYCKSHLYPVFETLKSTLLRWAMRKYKKLKRRWSKARHWMNGILRRQPRLFAHWHMYNTSNGWTIGAV